MLKNILTFKAIGVAMKVVRKNNRIASGTISGKKLNVTNLNHVDLCRPVAMNFDSLKQ